MNQTYIVLIGSPDNDMEQSWQLIEASSDADALEQAKEIWIDLDQSEQQMRLYPADRPQIGLPLVAWTDETNRED
jgi:hypothetical protein